MFHLLSALFPTPNQKEAIKGRKQLIYKPKPEVWVFSMMVLKMAWFRKAYGVTWRQKSASNLLFGP